MLRQVCEARGEDVSGFIRRAVRKELASLSFFSPEEKKALGISTTCSTESGAVKEPELGRR